MFCSKCIETKTAGTVRADLITIETAGDVTCGPFSSSRCENVTEFKYLGMTLTNRNCKQEKNCGERSVNACCRLVNACYRPVLYSCLLYKSVKVKLYKTVQLPFLCVCHMKGRMVENGVLRKVFGPKRKDTHGDKENCDVSCCLAGVIEGGVRGTRCVARKGEDMRICRQGRRWKT